MTQKEFWEILGTMKGQFTFHDYYVAGEIRKKKTGLCPICVVVKKVTKREFENRDYISAGNVLGFKRNFTQSVGDAADNLKGIYIPKKVETFRKKLLRTLGLKEPTIEKPT